jgi:hypothetical protein
MTHALPCYAISLLSSFVLSHSYQLGLIFASMFSGHDPSRD